MPVSRVTCRVIGRRLVASLSDRLSRAGSRVSLSRPSAAPHPSRAFVNVLPAFARFTGDVAAPDVFALAPFDALHGERVVGPAAAHGLAAVV